MDVQCERCKTEYEFDDALVSGRGTTVRCTTCGHQFKVRRHQDGASVAAEVVADRWIVKTANGQQFTFVTLRELQRAILAHQVSRNDLLGRAGAPPRPLGTISELEPFFEGRTSKFPPPETSAGPVVTGLPPAPAIPASFPKRSSITWETDGAPAARPPARSTASYADPAPAPPPMRGKIDTLRPPLTSSAAPPQAAHSIPSGPVIEPKAIVSVAARRAAPPPPAVPPAAPSAPEPPTVRRGAPAAALTDDDIDADAPTNLMSPLPPPTRPVRMPSSAEDELSEMRAALPSSALDEPYSVRRGRRVGGWIVALVLLGAVGVLGWAVARPYLTSRNANAAARLDPRTESFLTDGEKAMSDGNLESAQESFDKASALAESDPRVLLDQARVSAARADVPWLKLRLLPATALDDARATKLDADERVARATRLADAALAGAPEAPAALRAELDALRLAGRKEAARGYVSKVIAQASQPETAYVLAALDLAEPEPLWTTVIDRLRLAAAGEGNEGRARAALVYALATSGDQAGAKAELSKLDALPRGYALSANLHALVDRGATKPGADAGAPPSRSPIGSAPPSSPAAAAVAAPPAGGTPAGNNAGGGGAPEPTMQAASQAYRKGDFARARQIYQAIVARNPNDSEAVAALGDVARAEGDSPSAIASYKRAIAINPSYLPALLGLADTQWASGNRAAAVRGYGDIADRFPEGTYPSYVRQRVDAAQGGGAQAPAPANPKPAATDESTE